MPKKANTYRGICHECGVMANRMTQRHKRKEYFDPDRFYPSFSRYTAIEGICTICGLKGYVASVRDFFYPSERALKMLKRYYAHKES